MLYIARETGVAVIGVDHIAKSSYDVPLYKLHAGGVKGSTAKAQAAASMIAVQLEGATLPGR